MNNTRIVFAAPDTVEIQHVPAAQPCPHELLIETLYSGISQGTELACLTGKDEWFHLPRCPGYMAVGRVAQLGSQCAATVKPGDIVFYYGGHQKYHMLPDDALVLKVPEGMDIRSTPMTRLATVAFTSIRVTTIELGDEVGVLGLGVVGNLAAQLATLQGAKVIGIDIDENRNKMAKTCGIWQTINPASQDPAARIKELTGGTNLRVLIDATGNSKAILSSMAWLGNLGELVLLGTPRGEYPYDATALLRQFHVCDYGNITLKGAHEWRYPVKASALSKHSFERNTQIVWWLIQQGKLTMDKLISHVITPDQTTEIYKALRTGQNQYLGVIIDWTKTA